MGLNDQDWRPITFQGILLPASVMGISVLESVLPIEDEELCDWLWRFPICCGVTKSAPAENCARWAQQICDLMLEQRPQVLEAIQQRLAPHGFDVQETYKDWIKALRLIIDLSSQASGECFWSAPARPNDKCQTATDVRQMMDGLQRARLGSRNDESSK